MIDNKQLVLYLDELLECANYTDYAPNGMQVEGKIEIHKICTAVTASAEAISKAVDLKADALLVHHGYFWKGENPCLIGMKGERIKALMQNDINLFAYHLPLDCHPELGNNACLAKVLDLQSVTMHKAGNTPNLLWSGNLSEALTPHDLSIIIGQRLQNVPQHLAGASTLIKSIAWCSGGAQDYIEEASRLGVDAYISGEASERTYYQAKELGIHYFACGHHATERFGIQALGEKLVDTFGLLHQFIDSDNPI